MVHAGITTTTVELELNDEDDDAAFAKWEAEMHHSIDHDDQSWEPDGPTVEEWHRELLMVERERAYREEVREAQIAKTWDPSTWARAGGSDDEFPF